MNEQKDILHYRAKRSIGMPARVERSGDMLTWNMMAGTDEKWFAQRPTDGCLQEFIGLADAGPEEVLNFARTRGVLGVLPLVRYGWSKILGERTGDEDQRDWYGPDIFYQEPLFLYRSLAAKIGSLVRVMQALRAGEPYSRGDASTVFTLAYACAGRQSPGTGEATYLYTLVTHEVSRFWRSASMVLGLAQPDLSEGTPMSDPLPWELHFRHWQDGDEWDRKRQWLARPGDMIAAPKFEMRGRSGVWQEAPDDMLLLAGYHRDQLGEWIIPYQEWAESESMYAGSEWRPSPLFNVLCFQLMKAVTLPDNTYFCGQCGKPYQHDPERSNKPRLDRPSFCSDTCRTQYKQAYDRQRYQRKMVRRAARGHGPGGS